MPLSPPPRDASGTVVPHDHAGIPDDSRVIRRISQEHVVPDPKVPGGRCVSTMAFTPSSHGSRGMSVDLEVSLISAGVDAAGFVTTPRFAGSVQFRAGVLRAQALQVGSDPLPANPHHGEVWGAVKKSDQRALLRLAAWFVPLDGVHLV